MGQSGHFFLVASSQAAVYRQVEARSDVASKSHEILISALQAREISPPLLRPFRWEQLGF